jgi:hypothetical protein
MIDSLKIVAGLIGGVVLLVLFNGFADADMGPKPRMEFNIVYKTSQPVSLVSAQLIQCEDSSCQDGKPLMEMGPQYFYCGENFPGSVEKYDSHPASCSSQAYGYFPFQKLVMKFSDKVRESKVFSLKSFGGQYQVTVTNQALVLDLISGG